jgi:catalase (peroxidase I)
MFAFRHKALPFCADLIASGGQGSVYKAANESGTLLAVKVFHALGARSAAREVAAVSVEMFQPMNYRVA